MAAVIQPPVAKIGNISVYVGSTTPSTSTEGYFNKGDIIFNETPATGQPIGWSCSVAGRAGTWVAWGNFA